MDNQKQKQMRIAVKSVQAGVGAVAGAACWETLREEMLNLKAEASGTCTASGPQFSMSEMPLLCSLHP